jgi:predicted MPP superfamily phosphohydrolase
MGPIEVGSVVMDAQTEPDKMIRVSWSFLVSRFFPELAVLTVILVLQAIGIWWILVGPARNVSQWARRAILSATVISFGIETFGSLLRFHRVARYFPRWMPGWGRGLVMAWAIVSLMSLAAFMVVSALPQIRPEHSAARRNFLRTARIALLGAPAAAIGYGVFIERLHIVMREETIEVPGLPLDLHGLKIVQLTDIHLSPFLSQRELDQAVSMANETRAHVALVTGDLITIAEDPLDLCLDRLALLRADAGVFGCLGNHELYAGVEDYTAERGARLGLRFLRSAAQTLRFGSATLNLAGVDYQPFHEPYLVDAEKLIRPDAFNVLLSHNPDVFPVAARKGYPLTIAGHTHGGQVRVEILHQDLNVARFYTRYVDGLYREGSSSIFVSRGIGTIGLPARLGAPPEVALLRLCRI